MAIDAPRALESMTQAAATLAEGLDAAQRERALLPFDDGTRTEWFYTPTPRAGLPLREMDAGQAQDAMRLVATGLSLRGYTTCATIMGLEYVLDGVEGFRTRRYPELDERSRFRDPQMYYVAIFGQPGSDRWGWHFGGHHVSIHHTITDGRLAGMTPMFFGANPASSTLAGGHPLRPLGGEEDLARELLHLLDDSQQAAALLAPAAPDDIVQGNRPFVEAGAGPKPPWELVRTRPPEQVVERQREGMRAFREALGLTDAHLAALAWTAEPKGLPATRMAPGQREALTALIGQYLDRMPDEVAGAESKRVLGALDRVHFAWAGGAERGQPHYYRLQGPRFLVEYDNTQDGANHTHAVWRDPEGDFGRDLLGDHYAAHH